MPPHGSHYPGYREHHVYCVPRSHKSTFCAPFRKGSEERTKWNPISNDLYSQHVNLLWWLCAKSVGRESHSTESHNLGRRARESCVIVTALIMFWLDNTNLCRFKTHGTRWTQCVHKLKQIVQFAKCLRNFSVTLSDCGPWSRGQPRLRNQSKTPEGFADSGSCKLPLALGARNSRN